MILVYLSPELIGKTKTYNINLGIRQQAGAAFNTL